MRLAYEAIQKGGTMPTILNAANEIAVEAFLNDQIRFTDIPVVIEKTMHAIPMQIADSLETILATDKQARVVANQAIQGLKN